MTFLIRVRKHEDARATLLVYAVRHLRNLVLGSVSAGYTMFIGLQSNHAPHKVIRRI